jgi:hypothetical protein
MGHNATFIQVLGNTQGQVWEASALLSGAEAHLLPQLGPSKGVTKHKTQCDFLFFFFATSTFETLLGQVGRFNSCLQKFYCNFCA